VKSWLAKTLLWSAIALVVFAGLWMVLDTKWSGELDARRTSQTAQARELLPELAPAEDAGPGCSAALERLSWWMFWGATGLQLDQAEKFLGEDRSRPECWTEEQLARFALCDAPEVQGWLDEVEAGLMRPHCRLFEVCESGGGFRSVPSWTIQFPRFLERECYREFLRGNRSRACEHLESAFALAAHAREVPTVGACEESDECVLYAVSALRFFAEQGALDATLAARLQHWLASIQPAADWLRAIDGERVLYGQYAWAGLREGVARNGITHPTDPLGLLYSKLLRPWRLFEELKYNALLDEKRALVAQNPWVKAPRPEISPLFQITCALNTFTELDGEQRLRVRHARDLAEIALRLSIAGSYPITLDALGDTPREPFTNELYSYARAGEGYTLSNWSIPR
jgi:hypothetical protein